MKKIMRSLFRVKDNEAGTAVIEFSVVAIPAIFLLLFCLEIGIRYLIAANMNSGATAIIRFINSQTLERSAKLVAPAERDLVSTACQDMGYMLPCNDNVLDVNTEIKNGMIFFQIIYEWNSIIPNFGYIDLFPSEVRSPKLFAVPRVNNLNKSRWETQIYIRHE